MSPETEQKVVAALLHGQGCANSLKTLFQNREISSVSIEPLIDTILDSFSLALSFKDTPNPPPHHESSSQDMAGLVPRKPLKKCYYRCTYAKEQNCNATKRVQKIQDNPPVYRTTYVGHHMCKARVFSVLSNNDYAYGSKMIQFEKYDQVMSESVMPQPQPASMNHPEIPMEDKAIDHIMNQECDVNDFLVDDDQLWAYQFPPFSPGDFMFLEDVPGFD